MKTIDERMQSVVTVDFTDQNGSAVTPSKVTYRIDDVASGAEIKDDTDVTPASSSLEITILSADNRILDASRSYEKRKVSITWEVSDVVMGSKEYLYKIKNNGKVPMLSARVLRADTGVCYIYSQNTTLTVA